jgi:hypothetical protein
MGATKQPVGAVEGVGLGEKEMEGVLEGDRPGVRVGEGVGLGEPGGHVTTLITLLGPKQARYTAGVPPGPPALATARPRGTHTLACTAMPLLLAAAPVPAQVPTHPLTLFTVRTR